MNAITTRNPIDRICQIVLDAVQSDNTRRSYGLALRDFMTWFAESGEQKLTKGVVRAYIRHLEDTGTGAASINQRLTAIKKLCLEASDNQALSPAVAGAIGRIDRIKQENQRQGNWLTKDQAQAAISRPDPSTLKGLRDRAILAVLLGAGLRRAEAAALKFEHIRMLSARWVIDVVNGKGGKSRTVPVAAWTKLAIDEWAEASGISDGFVFRRIRRGNHIAGDSMSDQAIYDLLIDYGIPAAPHDCRRTMAQLAHLGGSPIEQIQIALGHSSIRTTERYLGVRQNLTDAPADHLGLSLA